MIESRRKAIIVILTFAGICVYLLGLFVGPRVSQTEIDNNGLWLLNVTVSKHFGVSLNKDSFFYMDVAKDPASVFEEKNIVQARPLLPFLAHFPSRLLEAGVLGPRFGSAGKASANYFVGPYLAFIIINSMALWFSYLLYARILSRNVVEAEDSESTLFASTAFVCGCLLIVNDLTKAFFFAAHTQMLGILTPLIALAVSQRLLSQKLDFKDVAFYSFAAGLGALAYGSFFVVGGAIVIVLLYRFAVKKDIPISRFIAGLILTLLSLLLPYGVWVILVKTLTGGFYNHEIARWHQVVWMLEVVDKGIIWLASRLADNFLFFSKSMLYYASQFAVVALVLLYFSVSVWNPLWIKIKADIEFLTWPLAVALLFLLFFTLVGYQEKRLAFPSVVMVIVVLGHWAMRLELILPKRRQRQLLVSTWIVISVYGAATVMKNGPFY